MNTQEIIPGKCFNINYNNGIYPTFIGILLIFVSLKFLFVEMDIKGLYFLIIPVKQVVSLITGSSNIYIESGAFYFKDFDMIIDKSCSGYNFWLLSFLVLSVSAILHLRVYKYQAVILPVCLALSYFLTIIANSARIISSVAIRNIPMVTETCEDLLHQVIGIANNLIFLIVAYLIFEKLIVKIKNYE